MGDNGRARQSSSDGKASPAAAPLADQRTPVDAPASSASTAPRTASNGRLQASEEASNADASDSAALQRPPRPEKARKPSATTPSSAAKRRKSGGNTPLQTPPETPAPEPERPLLSESQWEREIAGFGSVLNDVLHCVTNRDLVAKTAEYMASFPQHALRFQIKMKQRAYAEGARGFQAKLMLFYVLHEFLKSFDGERLQQVQREWFQTVDEVLNACAREARYGDKRNSEENRKRVFKTLARWEELKLYPRKIKAWKGLVMGECKPRRAPVPLPRSETERQAEAPDQLQQFELPPPSTPQLQLDRSNCPLVFERHNFDSKPEEKQHWRYTAIAFIDILSRCLGLSSDIALTACNFFHRVFDRGIYARERYKFAAACLFLSAKASSKRMKLLRMVRVMYDILETPLFAGDEELLEIERLQLLYYEMEVLQGINFELTAEMPFYYLRRVLEKMPEKFRDAISDDAQIVLEELFFLPVCVDISPQLLGEAAAYIATWNKGKDFKFKWCSPSPEGHVFNERTAKDALRSYRALQRWKKNQQAEFDELVESSSSFEGDEAAKLKEAFKPQLGGLRLDPSGILNEAEFTKKTEEDSKEWAKTGKTNGTEMMNRELRRRSGIKSATKIMTIVTLTTEVGTVIATGSEVAAEAAVDTIAKKVGPVVEIVATEIDTTTMTMTIVIGIVKADVVTAGTALARNIRVTTETTDATAETWNTAAIRPISTVASANLIATVAATTTAAVTAAAGAGLGVRGNPQGVAGSANETTAAAVALTVGAAAPAEVTAETVASTSTAAKTRLRRRLRGVGDRVKEASTKPVALADGTQSAHASSKNAARPSRVTVAWHVVGELITARVAASSDESAELRRALTREELKLLIAADELNNNNRRWRREYQVQVQVRLMT
ncbi:hypothetical protein PF005_g10055 [Phytophthora fragariae]|uniref:Cyclin N-terminal domain-containing protein n=1 Tax=Phytophthora fragariae TaxID=53985 RepID=A0A6A3U430_9STRA|nr:hypothetical protein PF011_g8828 [Phytophthora fragariae]KAE9145910.1 hypothetical protein PF006_g9274 [Phytophthora fragariae]KAE9213860.1 hypothetical protein PF005_g10055 [Phytophthora fragariae]